MGNRHAGHQTMLTAYGCECCPRSGPSREQRLMYRFVAAWHAVLQPTFLHSMVRSPASILPIIQSRRGQGEGCPVCADTRAVRGRLRPGPCRLSNLRHGGDRRDQRAGRTILPPLVTETVGRDIGDQIFERLAVLEPGRAPIDPAAYRPALAASWERVDSLTWRFHLRPGARWQDGRPVTSEDVRFSFQAFSDTAINSVSQPYLAGRVEVTPEDSATFLIRFAAPSPEQLYDATYHVRVLPKHIWGTVPPASWAADTSTARLVGSGPFKLDRWRAGPVPRARGGRQCGGGWQGPAGHLALRAAIPTRRSIWC